MCLLNDKSLVTSVTESSSPILTNLQYAGDWYDSKSPIQASSIDLHIGRVFLPGSAGKAEGSEDSPLDLYALEPGQTAIVSTLEELRLPSDVGGIGFPPNRVSAQGILMTNPGHVDPGYVGSMRFTVINMGKSHYVLRKGGAIVTLLFLKLVQPAEKDWLIRRAGKPGEPPTQTDLDRLSSDFLDVQSRAEKIVKDEIRSANIDLKRFEIGAGVIGTIVGAIALALLYWWSGLQEAKTKIAELEKSLNVTQIQQQMTEIDRRLKAVEQNGSSKQNSPSK